jgi:hypothetical protein
MKNEIDRDFYCSANAYNNGRCMDRNYQCCRASDLCPAYHRRYPTPEQFRQEYGEEYPDDGAVYILLDKLLWAAGTYYNAKLYKPYGDELIVCACTPFGKPDDDWRPE